MKLIQCVVCGSTQFDEKDKKYICKNCKSIYSSDDLQKSYKEVENEIKGILINTVDDIIEEKMIKEQQERISIARQNLYYALNQEIFSEKSIIESAKKLKDILPKDFFANFFCLIDNVYNLNKFILDNKKELMCIQKPQKNIIVKFLLKSPSLLEKDIPTELSQIIDTYPRTSEEWQEFYSSYVDVMESVNSGFFDTNMPRDVFVAYSSKDKEYAIKVVEFLERSSINCFISLRNLQHGSGAKENYESELKKAIDNCKIFLFISTINSRTRDCDALKIEMAYVKQNDRNNFPYEMRNLPYENVDYRYKKPRVEYVVKNDYNGENILGEKITNEFFASLERVYNKEQLLNRIDTILSELDNVNNKIFTQNNIKISEQKQVKYCVNCLSENLDSAKFCCECGKKDFVNTIKEAIDENLKLKVNNNQTVVLEKNETTQISSNKKYKNYKVNDIIEMGKYKNNVIKWEIKAVSNKELLLVSKYSIDYKIFDKDYTNWEISSIREWLNNDFYLNTFTQEEKQKIITHTISIEDLYSDKKRKKLLLDNNVKMIEDKVFLLTLNDIKKYFIDEKSRVKQEIDLENNVIKNVDWWLSSSLIKNQVDLVTRKGLVLSMYCDESMGIVPAILIKNDM